MRSLSGRRERETAREPLRPDRTLLLHLQRHAPPGQHNPSDVPAIAGAHTREADSARPTGRSSLAQPQVEGAARKRTQNCLASTLLVSLGAAAQTCHEIQTLATQEEPRRLRPENAFVSTTPLLTTFS